MMMTNITTRYDPTQTTEWQLFRQQTIGDSEMLTTKDKVTAEETVDLSSLCFVGGRLEN